MVDPERIRRRLKAMDDRLAALQPIKSAGKEAFRRDRTIQAATERLLQTAIQAALDITLHILAEDSPTEPDDYASAFLLLAGLGVIDSGLSERLANAAKLRNVLVHMYLDVDPEKVWAALENIRDLEAFAAAVDRYLAA